MKHIIYNSHLKKNTYELSYDISCQINYIDSIYQDISFEYQESIHTELKKNIIPINNKIN